MFYETVKENIKKCFEKYPDKIVSVPKRRAGSAGGLPFEDWAKRVLSSYNFLTFLQEEFVKYVVEELRKREISPSKIKAIINEETWWGINGYVISASQLENALKGRRVQSYQGSMADLVIFYGKDLLKDLNDVLLINIKSHDIDKESRDPNIISAKRALEFSKDLLKMAFKYPNFIEKANLWFIGIYYKSLNGSARVERVYVKDLFKLDVTRIPVINFDAAIQIQWHVMNMVERPDIDKLIFIESLADEYLKRWQMFVNKRTSSLQNLVKDLKELVKELKQCSTQHSSVL